MSWLTWDVNLKVRLLGETLFHVCYWMFFPFMALHFSEAFGKETAGFLLMLPPLLGVYASLIGGQMADRLGRRPTMLLGAGLQAVMLGLFTLSNSPWIDYIAFIGLGVGGSFYWPASSAMVADLTPEEDRRHVFATFYTAMNVGVVFGPVLGSFFYIYYRTPLLIVCTAVTLLYTLAIFFIIKESLPGEVKNQAAQSRSTFGLKEQWRSYSVIFSDKVFALYIISGILIAIIMMQLDLYMAVYIKEYVPVQPLFSWGDFSFMIGGTKLFGWMVGLNGLLVVLFTLVVTNWTARWNDRRAFIISSIIFGLGMAMMGLTTNVWLLFGCIAVLTLGELIRTPVAQSFVSKYAPEDQRGQYMGATTLQFSIGRFFAPLLITASQWMPPLGVFGIILLCGLISAYLYVIMFRKLPASFETGETHGKGTTASM
ncbi:MFS transporter [Brevibacillus fluminis]|uniref:MFS transporter n=1 Tax=Brevibacillus fluminis TaxID=511487 RepID=A0A3M8D1X9_9BACL|nr:MFS transporter [Brevibacillus fluminis]RNB82086.1 MFS transporter [Brevibacillus fluminis]